MPKKTLPAPSATPRAQIIAGDLRCVLDSVRSLAAPDRHALAARLPQRDARTLRSFCRALPGR